MNNKRKPKDSGERRPTKSSGNKFSKEKKSDSKGGYDKRSSKSSSSRSNSGAGAKRKFVKQEPDNRASSSYPRPERKSKSFSEGRRPRKNSSTDKPFRAKKEFGADKPYAKRSKPEGDSRGRRSSSDKPYRAKKEFGADKPYVKRGKPEGEGRERKNYSSDKPFRAKKEFGADKPYAKRSKPEGDSRERKSYLSDKPFRAKKEFGTDKPYAKRSKPEGDSRDRRSSSDKPYRAKKEFGDKPYTSRKPKPEAGNQEKKNYSSGRSYTKRDKPEGADRGRRSFSSDKPNRLKKESGFSARKPYVKKEEGSERKERPTYSDSKSDKPRRYSKRTAAGREPAEVVVPEEIRLNRYISNAGICSRRDADVLIQEGRIQVNGKVVEELGFKIKRTDVVKFDDRTLNPEKLVYVLLNKPKDYITTMEDPEDRRTVMNLIKNACQERIYPVGRLDRNTTGLLLFTNDGELAKKLTHPSHQVKKIYQVDLDKPLAESDFEKITQGEVELEDGKVAVDKIAYVSPDGASVGLEIHEGRNRIVRRLFEQLGYEVVKLDRVMYAGLDKKDLPRGKWRILSEKEVIRLKHF